MSTYYEHNSSFAFLDKDGSGGKGVDQQIGGYIGEQSVNFVDRALEQKLTGDDFLQAMTDIYSEPEVRKILSKYPIFVADVILIIDYDTAVQMDGFDDIISGNLSNRYTDIIDALERCGAEHEVGILKKAKDLYETDEKSYDFEYDILIRQIALHNDYNGFWDIIRAYIEKHIT